MISTSFKSVLGAAVAASALFASAPAAAGSIAYADPVVAMVKSQARSVGYSQVTQTYASNIQSIKQKNEQMQTLLGTIDTNGDKTVDNAEMAKASASTKQQMQTLDQEMANLEQPIIAARVYVLEQIQDQYAAAQADVVKKQKIDAILQPDAVIYMPASADVTDALTKAIDARLPQIQTTPPTGWQPRPNSASLYSQVDQMLQQAAYVSAIRQAQQAAANGGAAAAPAPATGQTR